MPNYGKPFAGLCVATAILICGLTGYPVAPDVLPEPTGSLELGSEATLVTGSPFVLTGGGFADGAAVTISVYSTPRLLAEVVADGSGMISTMVELPDDLAAGTHTVAALGNSSDGGVWSLQSEITVVDATALPFTGFSVMAWTVAGILMLVGGFVLIRSVAFGRRLLPQ